MHDVDRLLGIESQIKRRPFGITTKRREWVRAAGRDPFGPFVKTSKCRKCHGKLILGDGSYDFDHKNNKPWDNRQENCYLVCKSCHGKVTKIGKRIVRDRSTGMPVGYQTIRKKVGYKKPRKKKKKERARRRSRRRGLFEDFF